MHFLLVCVLLPLVGLSQPMEIGLPSNPLLIHKITTARDHHLPRIIQYLPEESQLQFCPPEGLINKQPFSYQYSRCQGGLAGDYEVADDSCIVYTHRGSRSEDVICLEVCDSNGICETFELVFISGPTVALPFVDDFSTGEVFPDTNLWLDKHVYINNSLAQDPPSIGVATFDGLDSGGSPYDRGSGFSDELSSTFVDLSNESDIYFSFFAQPKGIGLKPLINDSLVVDFRSEDGRWVRVWQKEGLDDNFSNNDPAPDFGFHRWMIADTFLHNAFQFRFRNRSSNQGLQELWHLDYIRVGEEELTREVFRDLAFRDAPASVLRPYSHMPVHQFEKKEVRPNILSAVNNLDQVELTMNDPTFSVTLDGETLIQRTFIEPVQKWLLSPGQAMFDFDLNDQGSNNYEILQDILENKIIPGEKYEVTTRLTFSRSDEILGAQKNNTVNTVTHFDNFYAYDDGTAESAIIDRGGPGVSPTTLAVEFHNNVEDELRGVQFHIPRILGNSSSQFFNLYVWKDSLSENPFFTQFGVRVYYADSFHDTLQGFTTYDLRDSNDQKISLPLPAGNFYIGWEQIDLSGTKIPIGYDINSHEGIQFIYFNVGQGWKKIGDVGLRAGSLMVRPIMGSGDVIHTSIRDYQTWDEFQIYPNPSSGKLFIDIGSSDSENVYLEVTDLSGKPLWSDYHNLEANFSFLESGVYVLTATDFLWKKSTSRKIFIIK